MAKKKENDWRKSKEAIEAHDKWYKDIEKWVESRMYGIFYLWIEQWNLRPIYDKDYNELIDRAVLTVYYKYKELDQCLLEHFAEQIGSTNYEIVFEEGNITIRFTLSMFNKAYHLQRLTGQWIPEWTK